MPRSTKICLIIIVLMTILFASVLIYCFGREASSPTVPPCTDNTTAPISTDITAPAASLIDYHLQGYLAYKGSIISPAVLDIRNQEIPPLESADGEATFDYMQVTGFPLISNEAAGAISKELNDNILELRLTKTGTARDPEDGHLTQTLEVEYTVLIDQTSSQALLCIIRTFQDNSTQHYYFTTVNSTRVIDDVLNRAYGE